MSVDAEKKESVASVESRGVGPRAVSPYGEMRGYETPGRETPVDLVLDANEGPASVPEAVLGEGWALDAESVRRYPSEAALEAKVAASFGMKGPGCLVTPGTDAALERIVRVYGAGRSMVVPLPTFAMVPIYARFGGAAMRTPEWPGERFPLEETLAAIDGEVGVVMIVSPNNPTGATIEREALWRVASRCGEVGALCVLDAAYVEFAEEDPTRELLERFEGCALVTRTFSKAWGLAGARVGYALGSPGLLRPLRVAGGPYTVASPSLALAGRALEVGESAMRSAAERVKANRASIEAAAREVGFEVVASRSNSAFFRTGEARVAAWVRDGLLGLGVAVRSFAGGGLEEAIRVTAPDEEGAARRVTAGLAAVSSPEAVLLDIDGVVAGVGESYRRCIVETARSFGVRVSEAEIAAAKRRGGANNDWVLTRELIAAAYEGEAEKRAAPGLDEVTAEFERLYQGQGERAGLRERETLLVEREVLERLSGRVRVAAVTGRPRKDAERFLRERGVLDVFERLVCMEDTAMPKPDAGPVLLAMERLGVERAWMVGDTPDDMASARRASAGGRVAVVPVGVVAPGDDRVETAAALKRAGAGRVLERFEELVELVELLGGSSGRAGAGADAVMKEGER